VEYCQKIDERIKIIKNKKNKGTFISRNIGVLFSRGKYIVLPDPDDILSKDILNICYKYAEKYNLHLIRRNFLWKK
jgi:glycosyltransferase involved in cell wall biosynthesis